MTCGRSVVFSQYYTKSQFLVQMLWFFPGPPVSSNNKTDRHDIPENMLKVTLSNINQPKHPSTLCLMYSEAQCTLVDQCTRHRRPCFAFLWFFFVNTRHCSANTNYLHYRKLWILLVRYSKPKKKQKTRQQFAFFSVIKTRTKMSLLADNDTYIVFIYLYCILNRFNQKIKQ